jgi:hypothetical protein
VRTASTLWLPNKGMEPTRRSARLMPNVRPHRGVAMHEFRNSFLRWLVVLFAVAFVVVRELQDAGTFDDLGLW